MSQTAAHCLLERGGPTRQRSDGVSVYYPFALVELVSCIEADEYKETGEVLLSMRDEDGALVTVRLTEAVAKEISERLNRLPDPAP